MPAHAQQAPGGVSDNLTIWLKADAGVALNGDYVNSWQSQIGNTSVSRIVSTRRPLFSENGLNFNPAITFDGVDDRLFSNDGFASHTQIIVFNPSNPVSDNLRAEVVLAHSLASFNSNAGIGVGSLRAVSGNFPRSYFFSSTDVNVTSGGEYIAYLNDSAFTTDDPFLTTLRQNESNSAEEIRLWGQRKMEVIQNQDQYGVFVDAGFAIGQRFGDNFRLSYAGDVVEVIAYSARISDNQLNKIESYLALKYGLTLDQTDPKDYVDSSGGTIYDADGALSDYVTNVAGIGRDDASGLNQKQSVSTITNSVQPNSRGWVTIGYGDIATTNALNGNDFSVDRSFMIWGNNAATTTLNIVFNIDGQPLKRMRRVWAIQETNNVAMVNVRVPQSLFSSSEPVLLVSTDALFDHGDLVVPLGNDGNGNYVTTHDFKDGDYFTFASTLADQSTSDCDFFFPIRANNANVTMICL